MKCPKCQSENPDEAKFCGKCGTTIEVFCHGYGKRNPPGSNSFMDCCRLIGEPKAATGICYSQPQSYTPEFLADKILTTRSSIEGERKLLTVLFADTVNYTSIIYGIRRTTASFLA